MHVQWLSCVPLFAAPRTVAHQAPLSTGSSRWEYWNELPFPSPWDLPDPGISHVSWISSFGRRILYHCILGKLEISLSTTKEKKKLWPFYSTREFAIIRHFIVKLMIYRGKCSYIQSHSKKSWLVKAHGDFNTVKSLYVSIRNRCSRCIKRWHFAVDQKREHMSEIIEIWRSNLTCSFSSTLIYSLFFL